ncbi:uncharacterized protein LOC124166850 [Ischnura elegans]|uniref:uncharacterized protein LOC124166850 n=1 Tax=Ischnura elegans TaxID=197161 RepID=UPI001ED8B449|nr:uncharacterized protein LOC124166850 [Ischnura elegans]
MVGNKCVYPGCSNSRRTSPGLRFFRFPAVSCYISNQWVENTGNTSLIALSPKSLHKKVICENHFEKDDIYPSGRLRKGASINRGRSKYGGRLRPLKLISPQKNIRLYTRQPSK